MSAISPPFAVIDGQIMPLDQVRIPVNDRSFLFGDSLYEVIATHKGKPFFTDDHLARLRATAAGLHMPLPWDDAWFKQQIRTGLKALPRDEVYVRIIVSRGSGDFNIDIDSTATPPLAVFIFKPLPAFPERFSTEGVVMAVSETRRNHPRSLNPAFKTGNYLNNVLCLYEAKAKGADDALILDLDGHVTEATTSNFFLVKDKVLYTAPLEVGILDGITRRHMLSQAAELDIKTKVEPFSMEAVLAADEVFVSSTIKGAMPVCRIDAQHYPTGYGAITRQLNEAYWAYVDAHLDAYLDEY
ncbi:MAG: branched-chain-amino acid aminotransferase [Candidatus Melainabacteria bacterium HGW-Melainabacteria-1]|nr:MAG: branched-chain-amino acid aminotransferase [Candidatus Melainabacteria bacterium HGW-Melainabacteria-1]